jgi:acyl carrier protein
MAKLETLQRSFVSALSLPPETDVPNVRYGETAGWDSVAHMSLVAEIEQAFDVMLSTEQVIDMSSFTKAREILASHGIDFSS